MGACAICPHMNTAGFSEIFGLNSIISGEQCIQGDLVMIARCDAIFMREGWQESKGANEELRFAADRGLPIYFALSPLDDDVANDTIGKRAHPNPLLELAPKRTEMHTPEENTRKQPVQSWQDLVEEIHRKDQEIKEQLDLNSLKWALDVLKENASRGNPKDVHGQKKVQLHLVPESANIAEAAVMKHGADKYGAFNWRTDAVKASVYVSAIRRHMAAWFDGEENDPESGFSHLAHSRANLGILLDAKNYGMLIDDRPNRPLDPPSVDAISDRVRNLKKDIERSENIISQLEEKADELR